MNSRESNSRESDSRESDSQRRESSEVTPVESGPEAIKRVYKALAPNVSVTGSSASALFYPESEHRGHAGWLHGGMAAMLLDHVGARLANSALGGPVVTGKLDIRYVRPVPLGEGPQRVEASYTPAEPGKTIRNLVRVHVAVVNDDGDVLTEANALFVPLPSRFGGS